MNGVIKQKERTNKELDKEIITFIITVFNFMHMFDLE